MASSSSTALQVLVAHSGKTFELDCQSNTRYAHARGQHPLVSFRGRMPKPDGQRVVWLGAGWC
jgi:hypothetical protein